MKRSSALIAVLALSLAPTLEAQDRAAAGGQGRRGRPMQQLPDSADRAALEARVRQRFAHVLKTRLGLTDEQMTKVGDISLRYGGRRRALLDEEREVRRSLRAAIEAADSSNQGNVSQLLDRLIGTQRQRIELLEQEQKDLSAVLTPLQRASYMGIEEQLRRGVEGMRGRRGRGGPPAGRSGGGPPGQPPAR